MTHLLTDSSVVIKWFHREGESELAAARRIRTAHAQHDVDAHILDLGIYEVGNVLTRALRWTAADVAAQLDDLVSIFGPPLVLSTAGLRRAAALAEQHDLSYYDAGWAAAAHESGMALVSADAQLLAAGLAESPAATVTRLQLSAN